MSRGLVVDLFAGGGGASVGIEAALGRPVDIAINHDAIAMAVHKANHPETRHLEADIWEVKPAQATGGRPVDLLWASPDCTHFSVAKGDVPRRQEIRSLAWAVVRWAAAVRPSVIILENVSEFRTWGPLGTDGRPVKRRMGVTFLRWKGRLEKLGYRVDFRILDAAEYGAPTRRRRLFIVARCDGQPIRWPERTHGPGLLPFRTAAECIDWSLPCPSIFERKRPLAEKTMWRIAQGIRRFVLESPRPFIIRTDHHKSHATNAFDPGQPLGTITSANGHAVVAPILAAAGGPARSGNPRSTEEPLATVMPANNRVIVTPLLAQMSHGEVAKDGSRRRGRGAHPVEGTVPTITGSNDFAVVAPTLMQMGYGEREGQAARVPGLDKPVGTIMATGQKHALVAAFLAKHFGGVVGQEVPAPASTITSKDHHSLAAATLVQFNHNNAPVDVNDPMHTVTSNNHIAEVRAFLTAFYGTDGTKGKGQSLREPARTITAKHRLGLVTVEGTEYQIVDIGMRMLQPHELLVAQFGDFAEGYDLSPAKTKAGQVRMIGNSVSPDVAKAVVSVNLPRDAGREAVA